MQIKFNETKSMLMKESEDAKKEIEECRVDSAMMEKLCAENEKLKVHTDEIIFNINLTMQTN